MLYQIMKIATIVSQAKVIRLSLFLLTKEESQDLPFVFNLEKNVDNLAMASFVKSNIG